MRLKKRIANSQGSRWTLEEEQLLLKILTESGRLKSLEKKFPSRSIQAIRSKIRKVRIKYDIFGNSYRGEKNLFTTKIAQATKPKIVFDAYAGAGHQTFEWIKKAKVVYASESKKGKIKQFGKEAKRNGYIKSGTDTFWHTYSNGKKVVYYHVGDAVGAAAELRSRKVKVDLIDLDTCGSTLPTLPTFLVLLKPKNLVITHGEFHSLRFKREDVLRRLFSHMDISRSPLPIDIEKMSVELDKAVKTAALRSHNETSDSCWLKLTNETWLGNKFHGMLRRHYKVVRPKATSYCINHLSNKTK